LLVGVLREPDAFASPAVGVGHIFANRSSDTDLLVAKFNVSVDVLRRSMWSLAVGVGMLWVGNDPYPVPPVWGTNIGSAYAVPFCIVPERGQVSENVCQSSMKQRCDVLHDDVARSYFANNSGVLFP
jgi:hypothetical protein